MRVLDFIVSSQKIECDPMCDFSNIASGSRGFLFARFRFSSDWRGCKKVAVFYCRGREFAIPLTATICEIPPEALVGNSVGVAVVGQRGDMRIPTNKVHFEQTTGGR